MFCENKLTNLFFKNQENNAKHNLLPFSLLFFFLFFFYLFEKDKKNQPRMESMNVMQCKS